MWENADQKNFEYGHFLRSASISSGPLLSWQFFKEEVDKEKLYAV